MCWGTLLAVVLGGGISLAGQAVQARLASRNDVRRRSDEACERLRGVVADLRAEAHHRIDDVVPEILEDRITEHYLPQFHVPIGDLASRAVREEIAELLSWLDRAYVLRNDASIPPARTRRLVLNRIDELLSAYRRHERNLPEPSPWQSKMREIVREHDELMALSYEEQDAGQPDPLA